MGLIKLVFNVKIQLFRFLHVCNLNGIIFLNNGSQKQLYQTSQNLEIHTLGENMFVLL